MKAFFSPARSSGIASFLIVALTILAPTPRACANAGGVAEAMWDSANSINHYFSGNGSSVLAAINYGYYANVSMTYNGESVYNSHGMHTGRYSFGGITTSKQPWFKKMVVSIDVFRASTNEKVGSKRWEWDLSKHQYECKWRLELPGDKTWAADFSYVFNYEEKTMPSATFVNVFVR